MNMFDFEANRHLSNSAPLAARMRPTTLDDIVGQAHLTGATVYDASTWTGYGDAVNASNITLEPGLWSLSNWGQVLVATIANGKTFTWNSGISGSAKFTTQASMLTTSYVTAISGQLEIVILKMICLLGFLIRIKLMSLDPLPTIVPVHKDFKTVQELWEP